MANTNLISLLKKSKKNDGFRPDVNPIKYASSITQLNSVGADQYRNLTPTVMNQFGRTNNTLEIKSASKISSLPK